MVRIAMLLGKLLLSKLLKSADVDPSTGINPFMHVFIKTMHLRSVAIRLSFNHDIEIYFVIFVL